MNAHLRLNHPPDSHRNREPRRDFAAPLHPAKNSEARPDQIEMLLDSIRPSPAQSVAPIELPYYERRSIFWANYDFISVVPLI